MERDETTNAEHLAKAERTLSYLSGSGKLNEEQADKFIELALMPWPPESPKWWKLWSWPMFLVRYVQFIRYNRWWEKEYGRENPLKKLKVRRTAWMVGPDRLRTVTFISRKGK